MLLIALGPFTRAVTIAGIDLISTANGKAYGAALFERKDKDFKETFIQTLHDEGLEPFWATIVSSLLGELSAKVTPFIPEQVAIIPGKLLGEAWHWLITGRQSINQQNLNGKDKEESIFETFFQTFVKKPSDLLLKVCGLGEKEGNFTWYAISQIGIFSGLSLLLKGDDVENLPGVNLDKNESALTNIMRGLGYTIVEQATFAISQTARFYIDFKDEFSKNGGNPLAKAIANVVNERLVPGHILLGISSSVSTYFLPDVLGIPKTAAAAIGEFPMTIINRMLNCRDRRATKYLVEESTDSEGKIVKKYRLDESGNKIPNYRFSDSKGFNKFLDVCDSILEPFKDKMFGLISHFACSDKDKREEFKKELKDSMDQNLAQAA